LIVFIFSLSASAQTWTAQSGDKQHAVLELFTAEGCGLCPAADAYVEALPEHGISEDDVIVLGFHVDYLDDKKAWVDRFASPVFSDRQRELALINLYKSVYTPEFVLSGEVIHNWRKHLIPVIQHVNDFRPEANIKLDVSLVESYLTIDIEALVEGIENRKHSKVFLAVIEDDIESHVFGGDNRGMMFNHQNVVRHWIGPKDLTDTGHTKLTERVQLRDEWVQDKLSVIALVQNLNEGFVLQGLELPLK
jgi:hypothetical protein